MVDEADADGLIPSLHAELIRSGAMPVREAGVFGPSWRGICEENPMPVEKWWRTHRDALLARAAFGTPRYVYHRPTLRAQAAKLNAITAVDRRYFAIKANSHPRLLQELHSLGFGLECVSSAEVERVFASVPGIDPSRLLFTPSFAPRSEYEAVLARGVQLTLDNVEALRNWPEVFRGRDIWLRIDLGLSLIHI